MIKSKDLIIINNNLDESFGYNLINYLNSNLKLKSSNKTIRLAQDYDFSKKINYINTFWIILTNEEIIFSNRLKDFLNKKEYLQINFSKLDYNKNIGKYFDKYDSTNEINLFIWVYLISNFLISKIYKKNITYLGSNLFLERAFLNLTQSLGHLQKKINSKLFQENIDKAIEVFYMKKNWKCIGSGTNYNIAKYSAKKIIKNIKHSCAFDVLENHKHIDISAESSILVFISNIWFEGYQDDAFSEIEKMISHNNMPIIFTNEADNRYDKIKLSIQNITQKNYKISLPVIKIPNVDENISHYLNLFILNYFINKMKLYKESRILSNKMKNAVTNNSIIRK